MGDGMLVRVAVGIRIGEKVPEMTVRAYTNRGPAQHRGDVAKTRIEPMFFE